MDSSSKLAGAAITPVKERKANSNRSKINEKKSTENLNPNLSTPGLKLSNSPRTVKSERSVKKSVSRNPNPSQVAVASPSLRKKIQERKFVIAKKKPRNEEQKSSTVAVGCDKCKKSNGKSKCLCLAYESLRASHEDFFKDFHVIEDEVDLDDKNMQCDNGAEIARGKIEANGESKGVSRDNGGNLKRSRDKLFEKERVCLPEPGSGRVLNLVKAFENLSVIKFGDTEEKDVAEEVENPSFSPSDFILTSENLGLDSRRSYSLDSNQGSLSLSMRTSAGGDRSRRNSSESSGTFARRRCRRKQKKATSLKPFMLRTEERGKCKEEEFLKKLRQMQEEEEKLRVPVAQGLPYTIDVPECLVKPPVKETTRPVDLVLHSDVRAVERAEFDNQVAEKLSLIEQYHLDRERQQKLEEEEETRRLRKELVPKAQPMPFFDRPFIPKRSVKNPTIPKEPKFHQHKKSKSDMSSDNMSVQSSSEWQRMRV